MARKKEIEELKEELLKEETADIKEETINEESITDSTVRYARITVPFLNVREQPTIESNVVTVIRLQDGFNVTGEAGDFYAVDYNGTTGFALKEFVRLV